MGIEIIKREKSKVTGKQISSKNSIICGTENPSSLGCMFYSLENGELATVFTAKPCHEGHQGVMHGGLIASVLDEVMGRSIRNVKIGENKPYMTAEMTTNFKSPILVDQKMYAFGRIDRSEGRCCFGSSEIINEEGLVMARATGVYVRIDVMPETGEEAVEIIETGLPEPEDVEFL